MSKGMGTFDVVVIGITACVDALALTLLGHSDVAIYDGSMAQWVLDPALPLTPGSDPG
jgi:thiosulfate/3-mercaptopyruvate sulfurtransferase